MPIFTLVGSAHPTLIDNGARYQLRHLQVIILDKKIFLHNNNQKKIDRLSGSSVGVVGCLF